MTKEEKEVLLSVLKRALERLAGRGMPEDDEEVREAIARLEEELGV